MQITRSQAAEILGVTRSRFWRLERDGDVKPVNALPPGGKRFNARFDASEIRAVKRTLASASTNGHAHPVAPAPPPEPTTTPGTPLWVVLELAKLDAAKRDLLLRLGQRYSVAELTLLLDL